MLATATVGWRSATRNQPQEPILCVKSAYFGGSGCAPQMFEKCRAVSRSVARDPAGGSKTRICFFAEQRRRAAVAWVNNTTEIHV